MTTLLKEHREPAAEIVPQRRHILSNLVPVLAALQFLTVAPALVRRPFTRSELGKAVGWFPLIGLLIGGLLIGGDALATLLFPPGVTAALMLALWVICTGALHLDGFLDSCDGLLGGHSAESRLRIMRDERVGAFAVIGGVLLLVVKYAALAAVPERWPALLAAPVLGRFSMVLAIVAFPYARVEGLGRAMKDHAGWRQLFLAGMTALLVVGLVDTWRGLIALGLSCALVFASAAFVLRRLPGLTGDIYGALCEVVETMVLLAFVAGVSV